MREAEELVNSLGLGSDSVARAPADPATGDVLASRMSISVPLEPESFLDEKQEGPCNMAGRVFHAGAFPTGAHHPLMGPDTVHAQAGPQWQVVT